MQLDKLKEFIRELIKKELAEANTTASVGGSYGTPNAFSKKEKEEEELKLSDGMEVVKENYYAWRNDESISTKQKLAKSMTEIRDGIVMLEKAVKYNVKLKTEMKFQSEDYMKRTKNALGKISEKLLRLSTRVKDMI
jgi:hypothetical protein